MKELQKRDLENKAIKKLENNQFKQTLLQHQRAENERIATRRAQKLQAAAQIRNTLDQQLESKRIAIKKEKEMDKKILGLGLKEEEHQDHQRDEFFSKLKKIQDANVK